MSSARTSSSMGLALVALGFCWWELVVSYGWLIGQFPTSPLVVLTVIGLAPAGALLGLVVSSLANLAVRKVRPKLRLAMAAIFWLMVVALCAAALLNTGTHVQRTLVASLVAGAGGILVGPLFAELTISTWQQKRMLGRQSSNS